MLRVQMSTSASWCRHLAEETSSARTQRVLFNAFRATTTPQITLAVTGPSRRIRVCRIRVGTVDYVVVDWPDLGRVTGAIVRRDLLELTVWILLTTEPECRKRVRRICVSTVACVT